MIKMTVESMDGYFEKLSNSVDKGYSVAKQAKAKGLDPSEQVEIPIAKNMAERVEGLISVAAPQLTGCGLSKRIVELELEFGSQNWRIAFLIAEEVAKQKFCTFKSEHEAIEVGLRVGLAYITNGVVSSPLEGFIRLELKDRNDGNGKFFSLYFGGPIRSAGTTANCIFAAVCDYVRKQMGYAEYDPTPDEVSRTFSEVEFFHDRITNLQYLPSEGECDFLTQHLPIQIDGDASEKIDVLNYKDLPRVSTNKLRNGFCLVYGEGLAQKFAKFWGKFSRWYKEIGMDHWNFLEDFVKLQKKIRAKEKGSGDGALIKPDYNFIKDLVAGRPILTHPMRNGGFRLRYGRARNTGLSSTAIHPLTMKILEDYIAVGTQLRWERPSKGTVVSACDSIEGPIVKLKNGNVLFLDENNVDESLDQIDEILFLGDALIPYGDFFDRGHRLVPPGYCEEWWLKEIESMCKTPEEIHKMTGVGLPLLKELFKEPILTNISAEEAFRISKKLKVPFHPKYTYHWKDINSKEFLILIDWLLRGVIKKEENKIILPLDYKTEEYENPKRVLELIGLPHIVANKEFVVIEDDWAYSLMVSLGFCSKEPEFKKIVEATTGKKDVLEIVNKFSEVKIKDKSGVYIGARMGRPEKAKMRKMTGSPHVLFPVGEEGGRLRSFQAAMEGGKIEAEFPIYKCEMCKTDTVYAVCDKCGNRAKKMFYSPSAEKFVEEEDTINPRGTTSYKLQQINIQDYLNSAKKRLNLKELPSIVKGVRGTSNADHTPEHLAKGILRAIHSLNVNKDGTVRYDMTEMSLTHFKPIEIKTSVEKLREMGYDKDIYGKFLVDDTQILELKPQDVVLPGCRAAAEEGADVILFRIANFIDDVLEKFYGLEKFYNLKSKEDLVGHLIISLAPHTSAGILGRIVGFSDTQGCYAHPLWHSAQRRDCDGDECGIMMMMDGFLNFSRKFLPAHRGATQDSCLVLTTNLVASEVDDMVFNMDVAWSYPLEFYKACEEYKVPYDIKIEQVNDNLGTAKEYVDYGYTHPIKDMNAGALFSSYKSLPTMKEKVEGQMRIAGLIRAVDEDDVARLVIERHFIRDLKGNLRKFSMQQFRCVKCNEKFRRPPLVGKCTKCGGKLLFTISEGSVTKYLGHTLFLASQYKLPPYSQQAIELLKERIESVFGKDPEKQSGLKDFFS